VLQGRVGRHAGQISQTYRADWRNLVLSVMKYEFWCIDAYPELKASSLLYTR